MITEYQSPDESAEFYESFFSNLYSKAKEWQNGQNIAPVTIPESDLENHFETNWGSDDLQYIIDILEWRGEDDDELVKLAVISSETSGTKSYIVDTNDLIIGEKSDGFFFHRIGRCWGFIFDFEDSDGKSQRLAYHMPGSRKNNEHIIKKLFEKVEGLGKLHQLTFIYNSQNNSEAPESLIRKQLSEQTKIRLIDMNQLDSCSSHDLYVLGKEARQYFNQGNWDTTFHEKNAIVVRHHSGNWEI